MLSLIHHLVWCAVCMCWDAFLTTTCVNSDYLSYYSILVNALHPQVIISFRNTQTSLVLTYTQYCISIYCFSCTTILTILLPLHSRRIVSQIVDRIVNIFMCLSVRWWWTTLEDRAGRFCCLCSGLSRAVCSPGASYSSKEAQSQPAIWPETSSSNVSLNSTRHFLIWRRLNSTSCRIPTSSLHQNDLVC